MTKSLTIRIDEYIEDGVIGQDPEWADMSNPQGYQYGEVSYVYAERSDGARWLGPCLGNSRDTKREEIERGVEMARIAYESCGLDVTEVWSPWFPVYGSTAFTNSGQAEADCFAEREEIAYFPAQG
jgi:hypothetical protein